MKSLYQAATREVRDWIIRENLSPGTRLPASKALAAQLHLTPAMALRACQVLISEGHLFRDGYKLLVAKAGGRAQLPQRPVYIVAYEETFSRVASRILTERGVSHRVIELSWKKNFNADPVLKRLYAEKPAGVIAWAPNWNKSSQSIFKGSEIPTIVCGDGVHSLNKPTVQTDNARGMVTALRHLQELGHRHIAHLESAGALAAPFELAKSYREACLQLKLGRSGSRIWKAYSDDDVVEAVRAGMRKNPEVTALLCSDRWGVFVTEAFAVPEEISVVGLGIFPGALQSQPPLTTVALPETEAIPLWACTEMIAQLGSRQEGRAARAALQTYFVPQLVVRRSTRAVALPKAAAKASDQRGILQSDPAATWKNIYPFLRRNQPEQWLQLDLTTLANHSMTKRNGWLGGEPLEHFPPGLRSIHGVPFRVLDEEKNDGKAVVTFRSSHSHSARSAPLPTRIKIGIDARLRALYFLHGCSWAKRVPFAQYIIHFAGGDSSPIPLLPLGPAGQSEVKHRGGLRPNIQDWWPAYEQEDFPQAHRVIVFNPSDPASYQRVLYSLEWINPRPEEEVRSIEVQVDAEAGPGLALVAVTAFI